MSITSIPETPIRHAELDEGSVIYVNGQRKTLGKFIDNGGEGAIYQFDRNTVAKIYFNSHCNLRQQKKIELLTSLNIRDDEIAAPSAVITDQRHNFCGYVMPKVEGKSLAKIKSPPNPRDRWKGWTRKNLIEMCYQIANILNKVYTIPSHYILIGDLNFGNFMTSAPGKVTLVDFDSVQIDDFPCPVATEKFRPPESLKNNTSSRKFLLEDYSEQFTLAIIYFDILCGGIHPFSRIGGGSPTENIITGKFPYNLDGSAADDVPIIGSPAYYWAFLPPYIREAFNNSFTCKNYKIDRTNVVQWASLFKKYLDEFPSILRADAMANDILISRYPKWYIPKDSVVCLGCNTYKPKNQITNHLCISCTKEGFKIIKDTCKYCGKTEFRAVKGKSPHRKEFICNECLKEESISCNVCHENITFKHYERSKYEQNGKIICLKCQTKLTEIERSLASIQKPTNVPPISKINFANLFDSLRNSAKNVVPFLDAYGSAKSLALKNEFASAFICYYAQLQEYPKIITVLNHKASLDSDLNYEFRKTELENLRNKLNDSTVTINWNNEQIQIELKKLPYYEFLLLAIDKEIEKTTSSYENTKNIVLAPINNCIRDTNTVLSKFAFPSDEYSNVLVKANNFISEIKSSQNDTKYYDVSNALNELTKNIPLLVSATKLNVAYSELINNKINSASDLNSYQKLIHSFQSSFDVYEVTLGKTRSEKIRNLISEELKKTEASIALIMLNENLKNADLEQAKFIIHQINNNSSLLDNPFIIQQYENVTNLNRMINLYSEATSIKADRNAYDKLRNFIHSFNDSNSEKLTEYKSVRDLKHLVVFISTILSSTIDRTYNNQADIKAGIDEAAKNINQISDYNGFGDSLLKLTKSILSNYLITLNNASTFLVLDAQLKNADIYEAKEIINKMKSLNPILQSGFLIQIKKRLSSMESLINKYLIVSNEKTQIIERLNTYDELDNLQGHIHSDYAFYKTIYDCLTSPDNTIYKEIYKLRQYKVTAQVKSYRFSRISLVALLIFIFLVTCLAIAIFDTLDHVISIGWFFYLLVAAIVTVAIYLFFIYRD